MPKELYEDFPNAKSKGKFHNENFKGKFEYEKVCLSWLNETIAQSQVCFSACRRREQIFRQGILSDIFGAVKSFNVNSGFSLGQKIVSFRHFEVK